MSSQGEVVVRVDEVKPDDTLILPGGRPVTVERIDVCEDGLHIIRWWRPAQRGEPGHPGGKGEAVLEPIEGGWGRYLGSLAPFPADRLVKIQATAT